jgi:hypothetical protein
VGIHKGTDYWASGARYTRIDEAAKEVRQKGGGGMAFWHQENPGGTRTSLRVLLSTVS